MQIAYRGVKSFLTFPGNRRAFAFYGNPPYHSRNFKQRINRAGASGA
jgi:hypothetical protein